MRYYSLTAALALALATGFSGAAGAQSFATPGPTPNSWQNAVPGPVGPYRRNAAQPETYYTPGYGSSTPPAEDAPITSPGNPQAPLGAGGISTGGQMMAR